MNGHTATPTRDGHRWQVRCSCGWAGPVSTTWQAATNAARGGHRIAYCPTPDKKRFPDRCAAERALLTFWATRPRAIKAPCRAYRCDCGLWHTTSQPTPEMENTQ